MFYLIWYLLHALTTGKLRWLVNVMDELMLSLLVVVLLATPKLLIKELRQQVTRFRQAAPIGSVLESTYTIGSIRILVIVFVAVWIQLSQVSIFDVRLGLHFGPVPEIIFSTDLAELLHRDHRFLDKLHIMFTLLSIAIVFTSVVHLSFITDTARFWYYHLDKDRHIKLDDETFAFIKLKSRTSSSIGIFNILCLISRSLLTAYMVADPGYHTTLVFTHFLNLLCISLPLPPLLQRVAQKLVLGYRIRCTSYIGSSSELWFVLGYETLLSTSLSDAASFSHRRNDFGLSPRWAKYLDFCPSCNLQVDYTKAIIKADVPCSMFQGNHCIHCWGD